MKDLFFEYGPTAGWILSMLGLCAFVFRPIHKLAKDFKDVKRQTRQNRMSGLKIQVWMKDLPLSERVDAGAEYVKYGGNGLTKAKHEKNEAELKRQVQSGG
jgi:hypothetical protein